MSLPERGHRFGAPLAVPFLSRHGLYDMVACQLVSVRPKSETAKAPSLRLTLVDLAGSEKVSKSECVGETLEEVILDCFEG